MILEDADGNRSGLLVRLVGRCETAAAMARSHVRPRRHLRLVVVAALLATWLLPGPVAAAPGAARGAVDNGALPLLRSATLPVGGPNSRGVGLPRGPGVGLPRGPGVGLPRAPGVGLRRAPTPGPREVRARYAILADPANGAVLWGRRSRTPAPPASLTKMLTALAVRASLDLDEVTVASHKAARQPARRLAMRRGQKLTVDQALKALMIVSANDVAVMLAETAGGSVARFSRAMDAESERLGLRASSWRNPSGLDARGHRSTAFDLAILTRAVLQDRWLARVARMRRAAFTTPSGRRHTLTARSRFLLGYRGALGVKTGFTDDAGHCLAAAATRGGRTLIAVVLHSPDNAGDAGRMLDWGFGRGRSARTGLRLPAYTPPASVDALLTRPPQAVERHRKDAPEALAAAGLARVGATPDRRPVGSRAAWPWQDRRRVAAAAGAVAALLAAVVAFRRLRQRA
jgi:D-alanyl-D-alanine carboxypeptidase